MTTVTAPTTVWHDVASAVRYAGKGRGQTIIRQALRTGELRGYQRNGAGPWKIDQADLDAWIRGEVAAPVSTVPARRRTA